MDYAIEICIFYVTKWSSTLSFVKFSIEIRLLYLFLDSGKYEPMKFTTTTWIRVVVHIITVFKNVHVLGMERTRSASYHLERVFLVEFHKKKQYQILIWFAFENLYSLDVKQNIRLYFKFLLRLLSCIVYINLPPCKLSVNIISDSYILSMKCHTFFFTKFFSYLIKENQRLHCKWYRKLYVTTIQTVAS